MNKQTDMKLSIQQPDQTSKQHDTEPISNPPEPNLSNTILKQSAQLILEKNDQGSYTVPAYGFYPHQWLWDSCFIAIGQRHYDIEHAQIEILSLFEGQWANGMLPNIILRRGSKLSNKTYDRHDSIWRSWLNPNAPDNINTSGITQPPMVAEAVVQIGKKLSFQERRQWYKKVYPNLLAYHQWLYAERDPHQEGLVVQIHPWETGLDNTPPWMAELHTHRLPLWIRTLHNLKLDNLISWFRSDRALVGANERLTNFEGMVFYDVQRRLRRKNYDFSKVIGHSLFAIEDLNFNCIFIRANSHLETIAKDIDQTLPEDLISSISRSEKAINYLWDEYAGEFFSRDFVSHKLLKESSIATLLPLYAGCISQDKANKIVRLLEDDHRFGPAYPVPSVPLDSPWFQSRRYWQGPVWINTNWLIIDGLKRYGFNDHAEALRESTIELIQENGFYEYFSPLDGHGAGTDNFSWTASLVLDLISNQD